MPAAVENMVSAREVPWHRIGTVTEGAMTAEQAAKLGGLSDWDVHLEEITTASGIIIPGKMATVRTHPGDGQPDPLGVVGSRYKVIQNEEAFAVLDAIVDEGGAHYETAGALAGGKRVFMSMKMPEGILVAGEDRHEVYLLAYNSHDGSAAFTLAVTPVRVVCQNTLTLGLRQAKQMWTLRHTSEVKGRIAEARDSLMLTFAYVAEFELEMERLLDQELTDDRFKALVDDLIPESKSDHDGWHDRIERQRGQIVDLYLNADTNAFGRGTKYAAMNAITEFADWFIPMKGVDAEGVRRAERALSSDTVQKFKNKGMALLARA